MVKISVIISTFNDDQYIGRCIRSLLNQALPHNKYEIIIINDGSTDKTAYALELLKTPNDKTLKIITNEVNKGLPYSVNLGINSAEGEYIVRVDADDYVNINFLSALSYYLDVYKDIGAVACDYILVDKFEEIIEIVKSKEKPIACGIMFRKKNLEKIGLYDEKFRCYEDEDLRIRFTKKFKMDFLNLPLYRYRKHERNMTNDRSVLNNYKKLLISKHGSSS